ncbi:lactate 2-monooxygenase [Longimicrobium sp.]|uniref:lactate 2-monooxygenase n=1 Tax=Longimicrobium sp. TaxID=2029185 RepID=UPI002C524B5C|nr:lactate 2-monooxygenase [Longimicrobium sp.]HSU13796.1 lactate 2-monooxygenase [Longimicrobium sp.]
MASEAAIRRQGEVYVGGMAGERPLVPVDARRLEEAARRKMSPEAYAYVAGGAGSESTVRANREAFERRRIVPRMLRDVSEREIGIELFGRALPAPLLVAPIGVLELAHPDADLAVARAAAEAGVPMIFSSQASVSMEECARAMGEAPRWFQLYWSKNDALVESFVHRAETSGCEAIVVTLDTTLLGWRARDLDLGYLPFLRGKGIAQYVSDPVFMASLNDPAPSAAAQKRRVNLHTLRAFAELTRAHPGGFLKNLRSGVPLAAVQRFIATYSRPSLTWDDLPFLRERTKLPVLLKGILHPDDARRALDHGVDGIVVSNHGGRQVDGAIAALDALPSVVDAVAGRVPVLMDSGIRGGADVFKALALGARAVCVGRPYVYALALHGRAGVLELLRNLVADFELTMGLAGCRTVAEIGPECLGTDG